MRCETLPSPRARMVTYARAFLRARSGATSIEYGLICTLIFLTVSGSIAYFANTTNAVYNKIMTNMP